MIARPAAAWPKPAEFTDPETGTREVLSYVPGDGGPLYVARSEPADPTGAEVVVAPSFMMEFQRNYRRDVLIARALASRGVAVTRLSYRGQGHSGGETSDLGLSQAIRDVEAVIARAVGDGPLTVLGTRLGGIVGAAAGAGRAERLIVNDPIARGADWVRELSRADRVQAMQNPDGDQATLAERLERDGMADVLGFAVYPALVAEAEDRDLVDVLPETVSDALLVQFGRPDKISGRLAKLAGALDGRGVETTVAAVSEEEGWWASRRADYFVSERVRPLTTELVPIITDWMGV